jgi:RNA polymerase sigma factor (TIGR02999 family)
MERDRLIVGSGTGDFIIVRVQPCGHGLTSGFLQVFDVQGAHEAAGTIDANPINFILGFSRPGAYLLGTQISMSDVTHILQAIENGDGQAANELLALVYDELRRVAAHKMANEAPGHTLQPTALVHEAWLHLGGDEQPSWKNRAHFFGAAAEAMRRILVDRARQKKALKRGGNLERVDVDTLELPAPMPDDELLALDEALDRLSTVDTRAAQMVKLCFFVGLTQEEAARELGVSLATVERIWGFARAWLLREIRKQTNGTSP